MCNTNLDRNIHQNKMSYKRNKLKYYQIMEHFVLCMSQNPQIAGKNLTSNVVYLLSSEGCYAHLLFMLAFDKRLPPIQGLALIFKRLQSGFIGPDVDSYK